MRPSKPQQHRSSAAINDACSFFKRTRSKILRGTTIICVCTGLLSTTVWCQQTNLQSRDLPPQKTTAEVHDVSGSWIQPTTSDAPMDSSFGQTIYSPETNADLSETGQYLACPGLLTLIDQIDQTSKETRAKDSRWFRAEYDFDSRGFNVIHFMGNSPLPYGFDLWGFIDIEGADLINANREDFTRYFLEIDIKKKLWKNGGIIGEYNDLQGGGNSIGRLGFFHKPDFEFLSSDCGRLAGKGFVVFKVFPYETDGHGGQASFAWNRSFDNILDGRLSVGGFLDVNFNAGATSNQTVVVTEHQIRLRLFEGLHLITEFRLNEFLQDDFGVAPGIQYRF